MIRTPRLLVSCVIALVVLILASAASAVTISPEEARQMFAKANAEYQQQRYDQARKIYADLINDGIVSSELFFNMGNACARLDKTGEAVLYYERARRLEPRDPDIHANLKKLAPVDNEPRHFILLRPVFWVLDAFSLQEWLGAFFTVYILGALIGLALFMYRGARHRALLRYAAYWIGALCLLMGVFAGSKYYDSAAVEYAIVMKSAVPIYSGPSPKFSQIISAPEGTKLRRLSFADDPNWAQVQIMDGQKGFVRADAISPI